MKPDPGKLDADAGTAGQSTRELTAGRGVFLMLPQAAHP